MFKYRLHVWCCGGSPSSDSSGDWSWQMMETIDTVTMQTVHIIPCCIIRGDTASPAPRQGDQFTRRERCDDILLDDDK